MSLKKLDLESMAVDELWSLHEQVTRVLSARINAEKIELEKRLVILNRGRDAVEGGDDWQATSGSGKARRKYPRVLPKYRNPDVPSETWSGRGKLPRWLAAAMKSGHKIEEFRIGETGRAKGRR
ncbi:H-NS histone family protein [Bradyrhizobium genosp. L]|uniref:H-NS histone family protein n=1 Tax=Bradyrhizobium genosp. L TaxID=83637 RepID=UPI0018A2E34D|nr:H-NS histone family protein [Bradyrhizobium genosp. L]QPF86519.1 H-NS histone family protein [Bradyrhizobium genosp. L]